MCEDKETRPALNLDELEGLRGDGVAKWYVVHTYSGHENKVKVNIEKLVESRGMQDLILDVVVPTEDRVEIKNGQRKIKTKKMFPGYVLVKMIVTNESWYLVRNTQGVTGFVGHGSDPVPLTLEEVRRMGIEKIYIDLDIGSQSGETDFARQSFNVRKRYTCRTRLRTGRQARLRRERKHPDNN